MNNAEKMEARDVTYALADLWIEQARAVDKLYRIVQITDTSGRMVERHKDGSVSVNKSYVPEVVALRLDEGRKEVAHTMRELAQHATRHYAATGEDVYQYIIRGLRDE
jgi:hypothetical protein